MSLSFYATLLRSFCIRRISFKSIAQVCNKFRVANGSCFRFVSLELFFGAFKNLSVSPGLEVLRECNNMKLQHEISKKGFKLCVLNKCTCCW